MQQITGRALVTGGCGFLGSSIVSRLLGRGVQVRVLALPGESTENLPIEQVELMRGNVLSVEDTRRAVDGVHTVFHLAALYRDWMPDPTPIYDVNMRGTFNVLEAARRTGVSRIVYTASIVAIGRPPLGELGDEQTQYDGWDIDFPYARSKYHSCVLAQDFAAWGADVRIVCPGIILGPGDVGPTPSGKLIINAVRTGTSAYTEGGASYVDVRDAAEAHVLAAERGQAGAIYLATAHNLSNRELIAAVNRSVGKDPRLVKVPGLVARGLVRALHHGAVMIRREPPMAWQMFEYSRKPSYYTNRKIISELGAQFRPIDETLRDAIGYFRGRGLI